MKVYQRLAQAFVAEGTTHMFGIMGDGNMYWMHELDKLGGVQMLEVRHEGAGQGMADGWARVTRTPSPTASISQRPCCGPPRSAAKHAAESKRGQHSQSIDPVRDTRAAVSQSPIIA